MHKLASLAIGTVVLLVILITGFSHIFLRHVSLFNQLVLTVSVGALVVPLAPSLKFPVVAHFCFLLALILLDELFLF